MGNGSAGKKAGGAVGRRRGMTSVLAMLYLVLFAALALGFYAQTNLGAQVAGNEQRVLEAQVAAESGLQFVRYQLSLVRVAPTVPPEQVLEEVYNQLSAQMDGTGNLGPRSVGYTAAPDPTIAIPSGSSEFIPLQVNGPRFRATITSLGPGRVRIKTVGRSGGAAISRAIAMDFVEMPIRSSVLDYGVAMCGPVHVVQGFVNGSPTQARASVLCTDGSSATPVLLDNGDAGIGGDVFLTRAGASVGGPGSVAGVSDPAERATHIHAGIAAPEFPLSDPSTFTAYLAGNETLVTGSTSAGYLSNIRIAAGANPTFTGGTYEGVILVEAPNHVTFTGGATVRGVIVVVNPTEGTAGNTITFADGTNIYGPETLPESFAALRDLKGSSVLAPNFTIEMTGGATSFAGSILAQGMTLSDGAAVTVNGATVLTGTVGLSISENSTLTAAAPAAGAPPIPAGMHFTHTYVPYPATYLEVDP